MAEVGFTIFMSFAYYPPGFLVVGAGMEVKGGGGVGKEGPGVGWVHPGNQGSEQSPRLGEMAIKHNCKPY